MEIINYTFSSNGITALPVHLPPQARVFLKTINLDENVPYIMNRVKFGMKVYTYISKNNLFLPDENSESKFNHRIFVPDENIRKLFNLNQDETLDFNSFRSKISIMFNSYSYNSTSDIIQENNTNTNTENNSQNNTEESTEEILETKSEYSETKSDCSYFSNYSNYSY